MSPAVTNPLAQHFVLRAPDDTTVRCHRDDAGVMAIHASSWVGAYYGWGVAQGVDRAAQVEIISRLATGRTAEYVGDLQFPEISGRLGGGRLSDLDRFNRLVNHVAIGRAAAENLDDQMRSLINAFVQGIRDGVLTGRLSPEFLVLGSPMHFALEDCLAIPSFFGFTVDLSALDLCLLGMDLVEHLGCGLAQSLVPSLKIPNDWLKPRADKRDTPRVLQGFAEVGGGSNAWAVDRAKTTNDAPLFANDPHVPYSPMPPFWYPLSISVGDHQVSGFSFLGTPILGVGRTPGVAYGITNVMRDPFLLYRLETTPSGYRVDDQIVALSHRPEIIERRLSTPQNVIFQEGPHGTIVPDFDTPDGSRLSLTHVPVDTAAMMRGYHNVLQSTRYETHVQALEYISKGPLAWNWTFATADQHIGHHVVGQFWDRGPTTPFVPCRPEDMEIPAVVAYENLPKDTDPDSGIVATANDSRLDPDTVRTSAYYPSFRVDRAYQRLQEAQRHDVELMRSVQLDHICPPMGKVAHSVAQALTQSDSRLSIDEQEACLLLENWDGSYGLDEAAPVVFSLFFDSLLQELLKDLPPALIQRARFHFKIQERVLCWLVNEDIEGRTQFTDVRGDWDSHLIRSIQAAVSRGTSLYLNPPSTWRWRKFQQVNLEHALGDIPGIGSLLNMGTIPFEGGPFTLNAAVSHILPEGAVVHTGPVARFIADLSDPKAAWYNLCGGPSANLMSPWRISLFSGWLTGRLRTFPDPK